MREMNEKEKKAAIELTEHAHLALDKVQELIKSGNGMIVYDREALNQEPIQLSEGVFLESIKIRKSSMSLSFVMAP